MKKSIFSSKSLSINIMQELEIPIIVNAFYKVNWLKPSYIFEQYLHESLNGDHIIWVAYMDNEFVGYVTLKWKSQYKSFATNNIREIMDLNVLPHCRKSGIGSKLLDIAEKIASSKSDTIGLGVGLYGGLDGGYGSAQRLYVNRGYIPDGKGVTYNYQKAISGNSFPLDDDLILWFIKKLK